MTIATEQPGALACLISEGPNNHSREEITILAGSGSARTLTSGMVIGKRVSGTATSAAVSGNSGNGTMGAVTVSGAAKPGQHRLVIIAAATNAGDFVVYDPDGIPGPQGAVASAYSANGLAFTLADGSSDFGVGDAFEITVVQTGEKWAQLSSAATTGEGRAAGILLADIAAEDAVDMPGGVALVRGPAQVNAEELVWPAGITAGQKDTATLELAALGIIIRAAG